MTVTEKLAYIKGLAEGLNLSKETPEGKILHALIDLLDDVTLTVSDIEDNVELLGEDVDDLYECKADAVCDDDDDCDDDFECDCEDDLFEVTCGKCGEKLYLDCEDLEEGGITCPACGEELEFDIPECDEEDCDDCDCGCCH